MRPIGKRAGLCLAALAYTISWPVVGAAMAQEALSFAGKTLTVLVGATAGGSTDTSARLIAPFLALVGHGCHGQR